MGYQIPEGSVLHTQVEVQMSTKTAKIIDQTLEIPIWCTTLKVGDMISVDIHVCRRSYRPMAKIISLENGIARLDQYVPTDSWRKGYEDFVLLPT